MAGGTAGAGTTGKEVLYDSERCRAYVQPVAISRAMVTNREC